MLLLRPVPERTRVPPVRAALLLLPGWRADALLRGLEYRVVTCFAARLLRQLEELLLLEEFLLLELLPGLLREEERLPWSGGTTGTVRF